MFQVSEWYQWYQNNLIELFFFLLLTTMLFTCNNFCLKTTLKQIFSFDKTFHVKLVYPLKNKIQFH